MRYYFGKRSEPGSRADESGTYVSAAVHFLGARLPARDGVPFWLGSRDAATFEEGESYLRGAGEFLFAVALPAGNYRVTVSLGGAPKATRTTVKAASRRLMLWGAETRANERREESFAVNARTPELAGGGRVEFREGEDRSLDWMPQMVFEFSDAAPCLSWLEIERDDAMRTVFLAGDSTVTDQSDEPWASWGQMIPLFFSPSVAVANYAQSGESLKSFVAERRYEKVVSSLSRGDHLLIQFAHNDQKPGPFHVDAKTSYKDTLRRYIGDARACGAHPVLVTSMHRRKFDGAGTVVNTLEDYPDAMRECGREEAVPVIDLNALSKILYETLGVEGSKRAFVHFPARSFPGQDVELRDDSHFSDYGAFELSRCVVEGIKRAVPSLSPFLRGEIAPYSPSAPDPFGEWRFPASVGVSFLRPEGS